MSVLDEMQVDSIHDPHAEAAMLGAMLLSTDAIIDAIEVCTADDLYDPLHQQIFAIIVRMFQDGKPVDPPAVIAEAATHGLHQRLGNGVYLYDLLNRTPAITAARHYATLVRNKANVRRLSHVLLRGYQRTQDPGVDAVTAPGLIASDILAVIEESSDHNVIQAGEIAREAIDISVGIRDGTLVREHHTTGYQELDDLLTGIYPGQFLLIAGRPRMGKSVTLVDVCRHMAVDLGLPVVLFCLEMGEQEMGQRIVSSISGVPLRRLREGTLTVDEEAAARKAEHQLRNAPLYLETTANRTVADIRAVALSLHRKLGGLALIAIDYLQLLTSTQPRLDKHLQVEEISRSLKILSKDIAPVLAASQLNRASEGRADKRPALGDLRWSGEQDADVVILLHREDAYDEHHPRAGEIDLIVAKNRNGPSGTVTLAHQFTRCRLVSMFTG